LIGVLDAPELQADLAQAAAARSRAEAEVTKARAEIERAEAGVALSHASYQRLSRVNQREEGLIAQQEIDEAQARSRSAEAQSGVSHAALEAAMRQVEAARAAEHRIQVLLGYTRVSAPFTGVVTKRFADPGAMIQSGVSSSSQALPLVRLAEIQRLRLVVLVPESLSGTLHPGQPARIRVPALSLDISGRIDRFSSNLASNSRNTEVEIDVPNPSKKILPGMVAEVLLTVDSRPDTLTIPVQALSNLGGNRYVMTVGGDGVLAEKQIQTGFESAESVEVLSGLAENDDIVIGSGTLLRSGMKVRMKREVE
ncbi:MAG TPA: efflux RND transporter periplasmic adaptor subunit, partial [Bryobacteraceae bacterium]|nr:efflux RND transporter periplasmic adaptor subunit [Bryobacteraceae bacterium]